MGYLVPKTKKEINYVVDHEFENVLVSKDMADAIKNLAHAYHEAPDAFNKRADEYFDTMASIFREFNIKQEKEENAIFFDPQKVFSPKERTQENFKETFNKLWKSIAISADFKRSAVSSLNSRGNVAENYENYKPVYDRILMTKDMHYNTDRYFGDPLDNTRHVALRSLYLLNDEHDPNKPFTQDELNWIAYDTKPLNKGFAKYKGNECIDQGLFSNKPLKTPADLEKYLTNYETMLRDRVNMNAKEFDIFAQGYEQDNSEGDTTERLSEADLKNLNRKLDAVQFQADWKADYQAQRTARQQELSDELDPLFKTLNANLEELNKLKDGDSLNAYGNKVLSPFYGAIKKANPDVTDDPEVKEAQASYDQAVEAIRDDLKKLDKTYQMKNKPKGVNFLASDENELNKLCNRYDSLVNNTEKTMEADFKKANKEVESGRAQSIAKADAARDIFKATVQEQAYTDIAIYNTEVQKKLEAINTTRDELMKDPFQPKFADKKDSLTKAIKKLSNELNTHLTTYNAQRSKAEENLKKAIQTYQKNMTEGEFFVKEKETRIKHLKETTDKLGNMRKNLKVDYDKTVFAQRCALENAKIADKKSENIRNQLKDICEAMDSVKKISIWGNSPQYDAMVSAIKNYRENKTDANTAYDACKAYLKLSLNDNGGLDHMKSKAGQIRKQSCVRMLELLENAPDFKKSDKDKGEINLGNDNSKNVNKVKLDYETLKASLANKSDAVTVNANSKDAKAYSNLNAKISEIKNARQEAANKAPKIENMEKKPKAPVKGK